MTQILHHTQRHGIAMLRSGIILYLLLLCILLSASSHREAPLIANDPLADNTDLYAFRSPDNPDMISIIASYVPFQLPHGGPNYYNFGENVRYEIHIDNDPSIHGDEITYRFTFNIVNEDPSTFFYTRLGKQNQKATYNLERSIDGGATFQVIVENGVVPPYNVGPRSIESGVGLGSSYDMLWRNAITTASTGERIFAGPSDDPFFVDLGGVFDLGDSPRQNGQAVDGVACYNVSTIAIQVPIATLLKSGASSQPNNILDPDYVIGVWASASRPAITTLSTTADPTYSGDWVQVSRLGMPLTNEVVIPIGDKDYWNSITPYDELAEARMDEYFYNPELALYMDDDLFGGAVPALAPLRIQTKSLGAFDFTNGADGLYSLKGSDAVAGTALDDDVFGSLLLPAPGKPRSVDLWPTFHTGVPNVIPYQLATGKAGNPLAAGKPFINNFLPNGGDMLRLNMAVPVTPRTDPNFSSLGLIQAAAIGLTVSPYNTRSDLEFIPNMDGFPNGRRLEDDVTRIELQAVSGAVLAAVGLWYDDFDPSTSDNPVTQDLLNVLSFTTGVEANDLPFSHSFPYVALPFSGIGDCSGRVLSNPDDMACMVDGGTIALDQGGTDIEVCPGDGADTFIATRTGHTGDTQIWIITDSDDNITDSSDNGTFDLDSYLAGTYSIYNLSYSGHIGMAPFGGNLDDLEGCFSLSNAITVTVLDFEKCQPILDGCHPPQNIIVKKLGTRRVSVKWDQVLEAKGYEVRIGYEGVPTSFVTIPISNRKIIITGPSNRVIVFQVRAVCARGERSEYSAEVSYKTGKSSDGKSFSTERIVVSEALFDASFAVAPNPTQDMINIDFDTEGSQVNLDIYNLTGERVLSTQLGVHRTEHSVNMGRLNDGIYVMVLTKDGQVIGSQQVVKTEE